MQSEFLWRVWAYEMGGRRFCGPADDSRMNMNRRVYHGKIDRLGTFRCRRPGFEEAFYPGKYASTRHCGD